MTKLAFVKMQGLGNDFILAEGKDLPAGIDKAALAVKLCDRHFGIGADGLILRWPSEQAAARMQILNADGSEPEMCGNGLRCLVRYLQDAGCEAGLIETGAGLLEASTVESGIRINMGQAILSPADIPAMGFGSAPVIGQAFAVDDHPFAVTLVSMGNPHCVIPVANLSELDFDRWGPRLENHLAFPARINVEFVQVLSPEQVQVKVWERGAGPTLACGTGACAVLVAGVLGGWLARRAEVRLPGGSLQIEWPEPDGPVWMEGPAEPVFAGQIELDGKAMADQAEVREGEEVKQDHSLDAWDLRSEAEAHEIDAEKKYLKATVAYDQGDIDEALMLIRAALSLCPGNAKYHYNIGYLYWLKGLLEIAVNHYKLFLRYSPADDKDIQMIKDRVKYLENEIKTRQKGR